MSYPSTFAATPGWQPRNLATRNRAELMSPPPTLPSSEEWQAANRERNATFDPLAMLQPGVVAPAPRAPGASDLITQFLTTTGPQQPAMPNMGGTITRNTPAGPQAYYVAPTPAGQSPAAYNENTLRRTETPELAKQMLMADRAESSLPINGIMPPPAAPPMGPMDPAGRVNQPAATPDPAQRSADFANDAVRRYVSSVRRGGNTTSIEEFLKGVSNTRQAASALMPTPEPQLGEVMNIAGTPFVRTNPKQITPVPREKTTAPNSPLAKLQADLALATSEGRTDDAEALRQQIQNEANPIGRPLSVMEFNFSPELRKEYGGDYGRYRRAVSDQAKAAQPPTRPAAAAKPAAQGTAAPARVADRAAYDALPSGTRYIGPDGRVATKK